MKWYNPVSWFKENRLDERTEAFKNVGSNGDKKHTGEGYENPDMIAIGHWTNSFSQRFFYERKEKKRQRIQYYRKMAQHYEISDVIEDAAIECTRRNEDGELFKLKIQDENISKNENIKNNITKEFEELIYNRLDLTRNIKDYFIRLFVDGEIYTENIIDNKNKKKGILYWKRLPPETMDFIYDYSSGKIEFFLQYLKKQSERITDPTAIKKRDDIIDFYPSQINYCSFGDQDPNDKTQVYGYLEKAIKPYNQLSMLETSLVIYRLVRAPERFVFKIDVGNMPRDKAARYVEKMKQKLSSKESFDTNTGLIKNSSNIMSLSENFFLPTSSQGRGSDITSIGGNTGAFRDMDDIYYFQRKLYKSLKYPLSRVQQMQEGRSGDNIFGGERWGELARDEIKWSVFLEEAQNDFCDTLTDCFLIHLDLKGLKKQYDLDKNKINITLNTPNNYRDQIKQNLLQSKFDNYMTLARQDEFSKRWLMKEYMNLSDEKIKENSDSFKKDIELGFKEEGESGSRW